MPYPIGRKHWSAATRPTRPHAPQGPERVGLPTAAEYFATDRGAPTPAAGTEGWRLGPGGQPAYSGATPRVCELPQSKGEDTVGWDRRAALVIRHRVVAVIAIRAVTSGQRRVTTRPAGPVPGQLPDEKPETQDPEGIQMSRVHAVRSLSGLRSTWSAPGATGAQGAFGSDVQSQVVFVGPSSPRGTGRLRDVRAAGR